MEGAHPALTLVLALSAGVLAQLVARHIRIPGIVLLLVAGAGLGPDGLGWVNPRALGDGLFPIVELSVAVILFEGGLNLEWSRLRRSQSSIRRLVTVGAMVTLLGGALATRLLLDWPWVQALLFGSLVVVTGPTVVGPIVRNLRLRPKVATVLEAEGILIDPIGALIALLLLQATIGSDSLAIQGRELLYRFGFGAAAGVAGGFVLAALLRRHRVVPEGFQNIFVLASVLLLFQGCHEILTQSGLLAVTLAGVVVGNSNTLVERDLREFKDQLTIMLIGLLFVLLASAVRLEDVRALGLGGLAVVAALVLVVRPLGVWISTRGSGLDVRERLLVAWLAPRGIVAAAIASATGAALESRNIAGGSELLALVFLTIAVTVLLAGLTAGPIASLLGQRLPGRDRVVILGAQGLGLLLAEELRDAGRPVTFLDSNPMNCRAAEEAGFGVVFGDALQERTLLRAQLESAGAVIGLTPNQVLNSIFVSRTRSLFGVPAGFVAVSRAEKGLAPELVRTKEAVVLFDGPHDVERWDVRVRHGEADVERWVWSGEKARDEADGGAASPLGERCVILSLRRAGSALVMYEGLKLQKGDEAAIAIHVADRTEAHQALASAGWRPSEAQIEEASARAG